MFAGAAILLKELVLEPHLERRRREREEQEEMDQAIAMSLWEHENAEYEQQRRREQEFARQHAEARLERDSMVARSSHELRQRRAVSTRLSEFHEMCVCRYRELTTCDGHPDSTIRRSPGLAIAILHKSCKNDSRARISSLMPVHHPVWTLSTKVIPSQTLMLIPVMAPPFPPRL